MINPLDIVKQWLEEYEALGVYEPTAAVLCTRSKKSVSSRVVLIRLISEEGLYFFTNLNSQKSKDIKYDNNVALNFYFREQYRQIIIQGTAQPAADVVADEYFTNRSRNKQISAWASKQSHLLNNEEEFTTRIADFEKQFANQEVKRPDFWSGYVIIPSFIELWTEGADRRHTRMCWEKDEIGKWKSFLLYP